MFDRIAITTYPGYFFSQILCLRSIQQHTPGHPVHVIIDDFGSQKCGLQSWPKYIKHCKKYILDNFTDLDIHFHLFSDFDQMSQVNSGGWFRQQLVKLHVDWMVPGQSWLLVDADVCFLEPPKVDIVSATVNKHFNPIDHGNRLYVGYVLNCDQPWLQDPNEYWCVSSVPFRVVDRTLLEHLRQHVQQVHRQSMFDLHIKLFNSDQLVAYDDAGDKMIMSEFQLLEIFRHRYTNHPLPIGRTWSTHFSHSSIKDWNLPRHDFEQQQVPVSDKHWYYLNQCAESFE